MVASRLMPLSVENELTECAMAREQIILQIRLMNPTAEPEYLRQFSYRELEIYLRHLECASEPRGRMARWIRTAETPAITAFVVGDE